MKGTDAADLPTITSSGEASVPEDGSEFLRAGYTALIALALFNVADVLITQAVLRRGGLEMNPLAELLMSSNSALAVKLAIVLLLAVDFVFRRPRLITLCALWFVVGIYAFVVVVNGVELRALGQIALP